MSTKTCNISETVQRRDFASLTAVKISTLCVILAFERSLLMNTRKPCCSRETALCSCKIRYVSKFTSASRVSACDSTAVVLCAVNLRNVL